MRIIKVMATLASLLVPIWLIYNYWNNQGLSKIGDIHVYNLNVDDFLTIKVYENGTTGYIKHWANKDNCKSVELSTTDYRPSLNSRLGMGGSGGWKYFKFKAIKRGVDSVKIHSCFYKDIKKDIAFKHANPDHTIVIKSSFPQSHHHRNKYRYHHQKCSYVKIGVKKIVFFEYDNGKYNSINRL